MKILLLHSDFIEWEPKKKAIKGAEEIEKKVSSVDEVLVVFSSVEKSDEGKERSIISKTSKEIAKVAREVSAKNIVVYPYVHLSTNPSSPSTAIKVLKGVEKDLKEMKFEVYSAPFGYYKRFKISVKGHPLSELSREIMPESEEFSDSWEARMESASHLVFETTKKMMGQEFISISETSGNKSVLHWKYLKFNIDDGLIERIQKEVNKNLSSDLGMKIEDLSRTEAFKKCGKIFEKAVPRGTKTLRVVSIGDLPPEPCSKPHVSSTREIGNRIDITGYKKIDKDNVDISISVPLGKGEKNEQEVSDAVKKEEKLKSKWFILTPDGRKHPIKISNGKPVGFDFSRHRKFEKLVKYEMAKSRKVDQEPPHVSLMRKLELVDYEPGSDPGNFRFLPSGKLIKSLLEDFVTKKMIDYGAMEVETPIMYDYEHPSLKDYINRFPARQYTIETPNKRVFLRFAACFGSFLLLHDSNISYRNLPLRIYEMTRYSFRAEQRGELAGLRRLRSFSMSDAHGLCSDMKQSKEEFIRRFNVAKDIQQSIGLDFRDDFEFSLRAVKDFYEENKDFVKRIVKMMGKPVLIEIWDEKFFYFIFKMEWNFVDALEKASCLTTDQIDVENAKRYGIRFIDKDNKKKYPIILHLSPSGSIERVMYALLEKAYMESKEGKNPTLPLWLTPTQVRFIPVSEKFLKYTEKMAEEISNENIRVDIDDRNETVQKKIRNSELYWIPFTVVIGEKELKDKKLAVRFRETGKVKRLSKKGLVDIIKKEAKGMPFKELSLPRRITKRPVFIG